MDISIIVGNNILHKTLCGGNKMNKKNKMISTLLCICLLLCTITFPTQALSKVGSRGTEVTNIQTRLKDWGYYTGSIDGIYGTQTRDAVKFFQQKA